MKDDRLAARSLSPPASLAAAWIWYAAMGIAALALGGFTIMLNSDLWFHLAAGRLILETHTIPRVDSWSFTAAGQPWHNHEWLSDVIFQAWAQAFDVNALVYWQWGLIVATFLILFRVVERLSGSYLLSFLLTGFAVVVAAPFFDIRPHLYSLLFFVVLLQQILVRRAPSRALPLLFLLWINLHGGAVFGLMVLALGVVGSVLLPEPDEAPGRARKAHLTRLGGLWAACVLACLVNPFGMDALAYPFRLALASNSPSRTTLTEWLPPFIPGGIQSPLYPLAIGLFVTGGLSMLFTDVFRTRKRVAWLSLALAALTLVMSLQSRRFIPLFAISQCLVAGIAGGRLLGLPLLGRLVVPRRLQIALAPLALAAGLLWLVPYPLTPRAFPLLVRMESMPVDVLDFAEINRLEGRIFSYFLWAGYVDYRTAGQLRVYIDPRSETVFNPATQMNYMQVHALKPGWEGVLDASNADYVLWPFNHEPWRQLISTLTASGRWRFLYGDSVAVLLARSDTRVPPRLLPTEPSAYRSLALARREIARNNLPDAEDFLADALDQMPVLPDACVDLVRVQVAQAQREKAIGTAVRCRQMMLDERRRGILRELIGDA